MRSLRFVGLALEVLSLESITWVLTSLKVDEMTPTERAIQSRIKEAFANKISAALWEAIIEQMQGRHRHALPPKHRFGRRTSQSEFNAGKNYLKTNYVFPDRKGVPPF